MSSAGTALPSSHVDGARLWRRIIDMARYGARPDGGVDRPALSAAEAQARARLVAWGREIGLTPFTDQGANLFLRLEGEDRSLPPVVTGSHIDSQPTGGRFDGVYGVIAGLEAVEAIIASGRRAKRPIEIVAWTNEEGSRFAPGMTGSQLYVGQKTMADVAAILDADGIRMTDAIDAILASDTDIALRDFGRPVAAYVEAHIEQGPDLEAAGIPVGIVTGIQGTRRYRIFVTGEAAHAGTARRSERRDALMSAVRIINALDEKAAIHPEFKLTVGLFEVTPNAPSVVPSNVMFSLDIRHNENALVDAMDRDLRRTAARQAGPCEVEIRQIAHAPSLDFSPTIRDIIREAADACGTASMDIHSAAGHDARQMHHVCPSGMIFIPCRGGISHNPAERAEPEHALAGAEVLCDTIWRLANADQP